MAGRSSITLQAYAKLNLALAVGPPEPPNSAQAGWHPIASWMHAINLTDEVTIGKLAPGEESEFEVTWADGSPVEWPRSSDLVVRAHALIQRIAGRPLSCVVRVRKSIPAGGGLGGGSSDAAAVMLGLDSLYALDLGPTALREASAEIGSDIAFFIDRPSHDNARQATPRPALVTGFGDAITRLDRAEAGVVLVFPPFGCPTGDVYRAYDAGPPEDLRPERVRTLIDSGRVEPTELFNDLTPAAEGVRPELAELRTSIAAKLRRAVHVSGSGSTLFLIAPEDVRRQVRKIAPRCKVVFARLV